MVKGGADYIIEYFGSLCKLGLMIFAKKVNRSEETTNAVYVAILLTVQLIIFLFLRNKRMHSEKNKLLTINSMDSSMYFTIVFSAYIGLL